MLVYTKIQFFSERFFYEKGLLLNASNVERINTDIMRKELPLIFTFLFIYFISSEIFGQEHKWKKAKEEKGITISYHDVHEGDTVSTRAMLVEFEVKAPPEAVLNLLNNSEHLKAWNTSIKNATIYTLTDTNWRSYVLYRIPRPLPQQDLITYCEVHQDGDTLVVIMNAEPNFLPPKKGVKRQLRYKAKWTLRPAGEEVTLVELDATSYAKPVFPRFIQDPLLQRNLIKSFSKLRELSEKKDK